REPKPLSLGLSVASLRSEGYGLLEFWLEPTRWVALEHGGIGAEHLALACYAAVLARQAGVDEVTVACQRSTRSAAIAEAIGPYQQALPLTIRVGADDTLEALARAIERSWAGVDAARDGYDGRLACDAQFAWLPAEAPGLAAHGVIAAERSVNTRAALRLTCRVSEDGLAVGLEYDRTRLDEAAVRCLREQWELAIDALHDHVAMPVGELALLGAHQRALLTPTAEPAWHDRTVLSQIEARARQTPDAIALVDELTRVSYAALDERANRLARWLGQQGCVRGDVIAILLPPQADYVVAILAAHKLGAAYLPLDPTYPRERLSYMLADSAARVVVCRSHQAVLCEGSATVLQLDAHAAEIAACANEPPLSPCQPTDLAYLIYTSGSSGQPKAVAIGQRSLSLSTHARVAHYARPLSAYLLLSTFAFDSSVAGIFWTLAQGGKLVLASREQQRDPSAIAALCRREAVSHALSLPSLYEALLELPGFGLTSALSTWIVAGEACKPSVVRRHQQQLPDVELSNEYGPTEGTVWATVARLEHSQVADVVSIGRAIAGMQLWVLNEAGVPAALGEAGEVFLGGPLLALGYHGRPEATRERFFVHPQLGTRVYRTSDRARVGTDGQLYFLGRTDRQIKVRGHRVELPEIEQHLLAFDGVREAAVVPLEHEAGVRLIAFVESDLSPERSVPALRAHLEAALPAYMTPADFVVLPVLPRTPNGKLDLAALPPLWALPARVERQFVAPTSELERELAALCGELLHVTQVSADASFFELGGDSITSLQLCARAAQRGIVLQVREVFEHKTIAGMARVAQRQDVGVLQLDVQLERALEPSDAWHVVNQAAERYRLRTADVLAALISSLFPARSELQIVLEHGFDVQGRAEQQFYQTLHRWPCTAADWDVRLSHAQLAARQSSEHEPSVSADVWICVDPLGSEPSSRTGHAALRLDALGTTPRLYWRSDSQHHDRAALDGYAIQLSCAVVALAAHLQADATPGLSASDFPDAGLDAQSLDALLGSLESS
ncbi:MAG: amino acid adenylation domain-containing protein, partial [Polyangiales bacterium]